MKTEDKVMEIAEKFAPPQKVIDPSTSPEAITRERRKTHGDWKSQAARAQNIKAAVLGDHKGLKLEAYQQEAIEMICVKLSRIVTGNPDEPDHWDDIAGYAYLGKGGHDQ